MDGKFEGRKLHDAPSEEGFEGFRSKVEDGLNNYRVCIEELIAAQQRFDGIGQGRIAGDEAHAKERLEVARTAAHEAARRLNHFARITDPEPFL